MSKSVGRGKAMPLAGTDGNTDFGMDKSCRSHKFFVTAKTRDTNAQYASEGYVKFSGVSNPQAIP